MTTRPARFAIRTSSSLTRAALGAVLVSAAVALSLGFASASAHPLAHLSARASLTSARAGKCRGARRHGTHRGSACRRAHRGGTAAKVSASTPLAISIADGWWLLPTVTISSGPAAGSVSSSGRASFAFESATAHAAFECSLDGKRYSGCSSPAVYSGLANGQHNFRVYAIARGLSGTAASITWTVELPAALSGPSTPTGLKANAGDGQVTLTWNPSTDSAGVAGYRVFRNGGQVTQVASTSFTDSGLADGTTYSYTVVAFDAAGRSSASSAAVSATPVAAASPPVGSTSPPTGSGDPPAPLTSFLPATDGHFTPLSDAAAAADVTPEPENRPGNTATNDYVPTTAQLQAFYGAVNSNGQTVVQANPYDQYVTGHYTGTTDEIIQWAAWKWGIPADWLRAEYVQESRWNMSQLGDLATVSPAAYAEYPTQARVAGTDEVYQSMGISQVKWNPDGSVGAGTEPLRWESTAFNADYQAATLRFYFDDPDGLRSAWGDSSYSPGNAWASLGGWFEPYPWLNAGQLDYIAEVQAHLAARTWAQPGF